MPELVEIACPQCSEATTALVPEGTRPKRTATNHEPPLPDDADTAVWTSCPNDNEFIIYLTNGPTDDYSGGEISSPDDT